MREAAWVAYDTCAAPHLLLDLPDVDVSGARALEWTAAMTEAWEEEYPPGPGARGGWVPPPPDWPTPTVSGSLTVPSRSTPMPDRPPTSAFMLTTWKLTCSATRLNPATLTALQDDWAARQLQNAQLGGDFFGHRQRACGHPDPKRLRQHCGASVGGRGNPRA